MFLRKNEVRFTNLRKTFEISIPFSEKLSWRRRIINLDLFLRGNYSFNKDFLIRQSVIGSIWRYDAISF